MSKSTTKQVEDLTAEAQKTVEQSVEKMAKGMEDVAAFGQENVDAIVASGKIAAKAAETVNAEIIAYSKKSYEDGLAAAKELTSCKSVSEFVEKQTAYNKTAVEGLMAEATKLSDIYTAAAKEVFEPLNARMSAAMEMFKGYRV